MTKQHIKPTFNVLAVFVLALALTLQAFYVPSVSAAQITQRSLTLQAGIDGADPDTLPDGGAQISGNSNHLYDFRLPTAGTLRSIQFEYCTTAADVGAAVCVPPTDINVTSATLGNETSGAGFVSGFTFTNMTGTADTNDFYLTRASSSISANDRATLRIDGVLNPSTEGTFFVRIKTFASADATGSAIDSGTVAAATSEQIVLEGIMPESLVFCAGRTVSTTTGVPDCSTATAGDIEFNQLFSTSLTASSTSQMAASTNAGQGYVISVNGPTLTSGSNTIAGLATPNASVKGVAQFGLNLRANSAAAANGFDAGNLVNPTPGADIAAPSNGTSLKGQATTDYNTPDTFKFVSGNFVANSAEDDGTINTTGSTLGPTDAQIFTVSYIANVPGSQPAGTYATTLTYICTPTF